MILQVRCESAPWVDVADMLSQLADLCLQQGLFLYVVWPVEPTLRRELALLLDRLGLADHFADDAELDADKRVGCTILSAADPGTWMPLLASLRGSRNSVIAAG